jgi:hypothetical protein
MFLIVKACFCLLTYDLYSICEYRSLRDRSSENWYCLCVHQRPWCELDFHCYNRMPDINNLKEGKIYYESWFQKFYFMVDWLYCLEPEAEYHGSGNIWQRKLLTSRQLGSRQRETKGAGDKVYLIKLWFLQWVNPLMKLELLWSLWSNNFPKAPPLNTAMLRTKPPANKPLEGCSIPKPQQ